jgi:hypothetical protein
MSDGWTAVMEKVPERELPPSCAEAYQAFERDLETALADEPKVVDRDVGGFEAGLLPDYDSLIPASWPSILGMVGVLWVLVGIVFAILLLLVIFTLPQSIHATATYVLCALGAAGLITIAVWYVGDALRTNREKREHAGRVALGTFLLRDGLVLRYLSHCSYFPRTSVLEVFADAVRTGGGSAGPARTVGFSCAIRFRDARGHERTTAVCGGPTSWEPSPDGARMRRIRRWFEATA